MTRVSIEESFGWAQRFIAREWRLVLPVAFAFITLPWLAVELLAPGLKLGQMTFDPAGDPRPMLIALCWSLPLILLGSLGGLAITALALSPGISVGEAIRLAARRLPVMIGAVLLMMVALMAAAIVAAILLQASGADALRLQASLSGIVVVMVLAAAVRLAPLAPLIVDRGLRPVAALRATWALGRGAFWRILAALGIYLGGAIVVLLALSTAIGDVVLIAARAAGMPDLGTAIVAVLLHGARALVSTGFYLIVTSIYRQLGGLSKGI